MTSSVRVTIELPVVEAPAGSKRRKYSIAERSGGLLKIASSRGCVTDYQYGGGRRGDLIKVLWWDGDGLCLIAKRLERADSSGRLRKMAPLSSRAPLSMLLEGIDWRHPVRAAPPELAASPANRRAIRNQSIRMICVHVPDDLLRRFSRCR